MRSRPLARFEPGSSKLLIKALPTPISFVIALANSDILVRYSKNPISPSCLNELFLHLKIPHLCDFCVICDLCDFCVSVHTCDLCVRVHLHFASASTPAPSSPDLTSTHLPIE